MEASTRIIDYYSLCCIEEGFSKITIAGWRKKSPQHFIVFVKLNLDFYQMRKVRKDQKRVI